MLFLASEFSESEEQANGLLSATNLQSACVEDGYSSPDDLKKAIYDTYAKYGMDNAKGVFEVTVVASERQIILRH